MRWNKIEAKIDSCCSKLQKMGVAAGGKVKMKPLDVTVSPSNSPNTTHLTIQCENCLEYTLKLLIIGPIERIQICVITIRHRDGRASTSNCLCHFSLTTNWSGSSAFRPSGLSLEHDLFRTRLHVQHQGLFTVYSRNKGTLFGQQTTKVKPKVNIQKVQACFVVTTRVTHFQFLLFLFTIQPAANNANSNDVGAEDMSGKRANQWKKNGITNTVQSIKKEHKEKTKNHWVILTRSSEARSCWCLHGLPPVVPVFRETIDNCSFCCLFLLLFSVIEKTHKRIHGVGGGGSCVLNAYIERTQRNAMVASTYLSSHSFGFSHWETSVLQL